LLPGLGQQRVEHLEAHVGIVPGPSSTASRRPAARPGRPAVLLALGLTEC
jgi:hypothetical protein